MPPPKLSAAGSTAVQPNQLIVTGLSDPIDGTKGFLRGDQYAVALALVVNGDVKVGLLGCPNLTDGYKPEIGGPGSLLAAVRGEGTWVTTIEGEAVFQTRQSLRVS